MKGRDDAARPIVNAPTCYVCHAWKFKPPLHAKPGDILICCSCAKWLGLWNGFGTCPSCGDVLCPEHDIGHVCRLENVQKEVAVTYGTR